MALVVARMPSHQTREDYEADVELQRDEDDSPLGGDVELQGDLTDEEEVEVQDDALTDGDYGFLEQFPEWKKDQSKRIRSLYAIADYIEKVQQKATKTKAVASATSVISGAMSLLGLVLAPATAGGSLALSALGTSLGAVAGVTNIITSVKENSRNKKARARANSIIPSSEQELEELEKGTMPYVTAISEALYKCGSTWDIVKKNIRAYQLTKTHPHLASAAKKLMTTGQTSVRSTRQVQKAFGGTALAMAKNTLMKQGLLAFISLGMDMNAFWDDWKELKAGKPGELAEEIRSRAREWEQVVNELTVHYESLKKRSETPRRGV